MPKKFAVITALALSTVVSTAGMASAGGYGNSGSSGSSSDTTTVKGGGPFSTGPVVVSGHQSGLVNVNGTLVDARCAVPWSNGAVLGVTLAPNSKYVGCNSGEIEQGRNSVHASGLFF
ncbi:hypothetical protein [Streptomyces sp. NPDC098781]|uniref:hypothetical protein n=1 Tax=Streptomyces sp. NPDC098781 TaxID=3366097 RepID=UPI0038148B4A